MSATITTETRTNAEVDKYNQPLPTLDELRKAIPPECFVKNTGVALAYLVWDLFVLALLYKTEPYFELAGWPGLIFWYFLVGMIGSSVFIVGHDCGHGTFSDHEWVNDLVGHFTHGMLFAPYWPWQQSHRQHHMYTSHLEKDRGHGWITEERYETFGPVEKFYLQGTISGLIRWHFYTIFGLGDGSHFWPGSRLFRNNTERIKCVVSAAVCVAFASLAYWYFGSFGAFLKFYVLAVMSQGFWLIMITYLQHQTDDIQVFEDGTWNYIKGQLQTVDRPYGFGIDSLLHHITDGHVAHHLFFTTLPHYNLMKATDAITKKLEPYGVYRKETSYDFLWQFAALSIRLKYLIGAGTGYLRYAKDKKVD